MLHHPEVGYLSSVPGVDDVLQAVAANAKLQHLQLQRFSHLFTRDYPKVGPVGMKAALTVSNSGKTNKNGHLVFNGVLPHRNPLLDTMFAMGHMLLLRFKLLAEKFPNMLQVDDFYHRRLIRLTGRGGEFKEVAYDSSYRHFKDLYRECDVLCDKALHQGRVTGQQELDDDLVLIDQIKRFCNYLHDEQNESYLLNIPLQPFLSRAGYDHELKSAAYAAHLTPIDVNTMKELIDLLLPQLASEEQSVQQAFAGCESATEAKKKNLFCAQGFLRACRLYFEMFVRCAAARPRTADGAIDQESQPLYKLFRERNRMFQISFFHTAQFDQVAARIRAAEEREIRDVPLGDAAGSGLGVSPIAERVDGRLLHRLAPIEAKLNVILDTQLQPAGANVSLADSSAQLPATPPQDNKKPARSSAAKNAAMARARQGADSCIYMFQPVTTVQQLWDEYTVGLAAGPAIQDLIRDHGKKWRCYDGGRQLWWWHKEIYNEIERLVAEGNNEQEALANVQARVDLLDPEPEVSPSGSTKKRGRPRGVRWMQFANELANAKKRTKCVAKTEH
eukprot:TRINITY_DN7062_c0_g1_i5.p1 TRINITY_DN7062_c0_g1~~TRINITY_DN7062_c0_g1_i5.p1  ORF type:complete len:560 (-),score=76.31 TRINITY_DN7062_c0_g1_i5:164-1843(-)